MTTRILIAEDNTMIALMAQMDLEGAGYEVLGPFARNAPSLAAAEAKRPDLALVDIDLAGGDNGVELARRLKADLGVPSLFVSGQSSLAAANADAALGVLGKPFNSKLLVAAVENALVAAKGEAPAAEVEVTWF